jgi:outer membrane immunogenic protein
MNRNISVAAAAALALAVAFGSARAADMPLKGPILAPDPAHTWAGFYVGIHAGYASGRRSGCFDFASTTVDCATGDFDDTFSYRQSGWLAGFQGGYNWMFSPNWLLGVEVDVSAASIRGTLAATPVFGVLGGGVGTWNWLATATAKLGWVNGPWLLYVKAGYGLADFNFAGNVGCNFSSTPGGLVAGLGIAKKISPRASVSLDYTHAWLSTQKQPCLSFGVIPTAVESRSSMDVIKAALNFQLGN